MASPTFQTVSARPADRRPALLLGLAGTVFIVYGSLFPFDFQSTPQPLPAGSLDLHPWRNRSDAIDNILLFVPVGAALWFAFRTATARAAAACAVWLVLGVGLQVLQIYLPDRIGSLPDAVNNGLGLLSGLLIGRAAASWLRGRQLLGQVGDPLALFLVIPWYAYESFPFLPTLDPGLLAAHVRPFLTAPEFEPMRLLRHALAAVLGTLALLAAQPLQSRRAVLAIAAAVLIGSEILVPYGELRRETLSGIVIGMVVGERLDRGRGARQPGRVLALAIAAFALTVLTDFRGPPGPSPVTLTPFSYLLWQGAATSVPTSAYEALAIGAMLWAGVGPARAQWRPWTWPLVVIAVVAGAEVLRVVLRTGPADSSTLAIAALLSPFAAAAHRRWLAGPDVGVPAPVPVARVRPRTWVPARLLWPTCAVIALAAGLRLLHGVPGLPYNVVALLAHDDPLRDACFAAALLSFGAAPLWIGRAARGAGWRVLVGLPIGLALAAGASLLLLGAAVPADSLDKVTGSLDLYRRVTTEGYWGPGWQSFMQALSPSEVQVGERVVRYAALAWLLLAPLTMAVVLFDRGGSLPLTFAAGAILAVCWGVARWVVLEGAITDNLTELVAVGGVPWLASLALLFAVQVAGLALRTPASPLAALAVAALTAASLPLGWWLLTQGLEPVLVKYGRVGSAAQFLLGPDRATPLSEFQLFLRWSALYLGMLVVLAAGMALARVTARRHDRPRHGAAAIEAGWRHAH